MKKTRGKGFVYQPTYTDKRTGERKTSATWWLQYFVKGTRYRESSNSQSRNLAEGILRERLAAAAEGKAPQLGAAGRLRFEGLVKILLEEYRAKDRRSIGRVEDAIVHLQRFFPDVRVSQIDAGRIEQYVRQRQEDGAAPATINRELSALRRGFRLAQAAGRVSSRPEISLLPEGGRREVFFEPDEFRSLLDHLPRYLKPVIQTAYVTGWRINSEILTLQKRHVDLESGYLRLDSTKPESRAFPLTPELREVLVQQLQTTAEFERSTGRDVPWLFHRDGKPIKDFRNAWRLACQRADVTDKVPDDFRRTAVRSLERAGVPRPAAMAMVGHRSESIYRSIAQPDDALLKESAAKLAVLHQLHNRSSKR